MRLKAPRPRGGFQTHGAQDPLVPEVLGIPILAGVLRDAWRRGSGGSLKPALLPAALHPEGVCLWVCMGAVDLWMWMGLAGACGRLGVCLP